MLRSVSGLSLLGLVLWGGLHLRASPGATAAPKPDVVLVTIDTLRLDAIGAGATPALDAFLAGAHRFAGARTVAPLTVPAHASLFSGLEPAGHGVHDNTGALPPGRAFPLLAEEFRAAGYATAAFAASGVLGRHTGLDQGFDIYRAPEPDDRDYVAADAQVDRAVAWLGEARSRPAFLWVHFYDPHIPYRAFAGTPERPGTRADDPEPVRYRGEVRRVDAALERLLAAIDPERAVVAVASDHGESLGAHGEQTHGLLCYGATIDALLAVRGPGFASGAVDRAPRSLCDLAPALRAAAGLPARPGDGRPLRGPAPEVVVAEALQSWCAYGWGQCFAATDGRFTLVESGPSVELFDRLTDPDETRPLAPEGHEAYERLDRALAAYRSRSLSGFVDVQPDVATAYGTGRRRAGSYVSRRDNAKLADPRPRVLWAEALLRLHAEALFFAGRRHADALLGVIERMRTMAAEEPGNPAPLWLLALAHSEMGRLTGNRTWHTNASDLATAAMERGYVGSAVVRQLIEDSLESPDDAALRRALRLAAKADTVLDESATRAVRHAARVLVRLGDSEAAELERLVLARRPTPGRAPAAPGTAPR